MHQPLLPVALLPETGGVLSAARDPVNESAEHHRSLVGIKYVDNTGDRHFLGPSEVLDLKGSEYMT